MMRGAMLIAAALFLLPAAAAGPVPTLYFLKDGDMGPVGDGILNRTAPDSLDPSLRPVLIGTPDLPSVVFLTSNATDPHPQRLYGPVFVGLWTGPSPLLDGNITATLYLVDGAGAMTALTSASLHITTNESNLPDPMTLIPPDPTDPEAAAYYIAAQVLAGLIQPPKLLQLGFVDVEVPEGTELALGFYLEGADGAPLPVPIGAATIQYDGQLNPTFLYTPWYKPDPPRPTSTFTNSRSNTGGTGGGAPTLGPGSGSDDSEDSPGLLVPLALAGLLAAAIVARRRLR